MSKPMKRTSKLSLGARLSIKSPKAIPKSPKLDLPSIPLSQSPNQLLSPKTLNDEKLSPRLKRPFKSQTNFPYPKLEELKIRSLDKKSSLALDRLPENDTKQIEKLSEDLTKLQQEAEILKKNYQEKVQIIQHITKKLLNLQFKERVNVKEENFEEKSEESEEGETVEEEVKSLKGIISEQTKAYAKLEEMYWIDTNSLKRENEKLKLTFKKLDADNLNLKGRVESLVKNLEELQKKSYEKTDEYEIKLNAINANLKEKNTELYSLSEILRKIQNEKRVKDDTFKELQRQISILTQSNKILENDLNCQKRELKIAAENLFNEREKLKLFEDQSSEFLSMKEKFEGLEDSLKSTQKTLEFTTSNYSSLRAKYSQLKTRFKEKEEILRETKEKLSEASSPTIPVSNPQRLRRTLTLSTVSSSGDTQQKENFARLYSKISNLEEELQSERLEKEKFKKNFEYSKKITDEKAEIIQKLEKNAQKDIEDGINLAKEALGVKIKELSGRCHWFLRVLSEKLRCEKCKITDSVKFSGLNCDHLLCKNCAMFLDSCPCCTNGGKVIKLNVLSSVSYNSSRLSEILSDLFLLINPKN
jgi:myosin heavy subunit